MKKINNIILFGFFFVLSFISKEAYSSGIGIYFPTNSYLGTGTINNKDVNLTHSGFGVFYDSQITAKNDINIKIALIYERVINKNVKNSSYDYSSKYDRYSVPNYNRYAIDIFSGFRMLKSERIRLWWGPHIRLSYMSHKSQITVSTQTLNDESLLGFGVGLITGCNIPIKNKISINLEIGGRAYLYTGLGKNTDPISGALWGRYAELFFNSGIILHLGSEQ